MKQGFQEILDSLENKKSELAAKMFDAVFAFASKHGYCGDEEEEPYLLDSECLYQCDEPQIGALDLAGKLVDILSFSQYQLKSASKDINEAMKLGSTPCQATRNLKAWDEN